MAPRPGRLERITNLVLALLETERPLSLREIGSVVAGYPLEHVALRQAFERDKRTLRESGIRIDLVRIDGEDQVGYRIDKEHYYLPQLDLSEEEKEALGFALAAVRLEGGMVNEIAQKLGAGVPAGLPPVALLPSAAHLGQLQEAIRTRSVVRFDYGGVGREVAGYGLVFKGGRWYFVGADKTKDGELRTFRVDRITTEPIAGPAGAYEPPFGFDARSELHFSYFESPSAYDHDEQLGPLVVRLLVDVREVAALSELFGEDRVRERHDDGSATFELEVGDEEAFVLYVLGLGDSVEVLEPALLRALVIDRLELAAARGST